jgi:hypothetical protein
MKLVGCSILIALGSASIPAAAIQPTSAMSTATPSSVESMGLARRFVALTISSDELIDGIRTGVMQGAMRSLDAIEDEKERSAVADQVQRYAAGLEPRIKESVPGILEAYARVYAREFSTEELREMVLFGDTPTGKHYLTSVGAMDSEPEVTEAYEKLQENLMPAVDEANEERCAKRAAERLASGDTKAKCNLTAKDEARAS